MNTSGTVSFLVFYVIYALFLVLYALIWYVIYKGLGRVKNSTISASAKLLAYRKRTGILIVFPTVGAAILLFLYVSGTINNLLLAIVPFVIMLLIFIFAFTTYRKKVILLTNEIKQANPTVGTVAKFAFGFSSFRESAILFLVFLGGILFIILLIWVLLKYNLI